MSRFLLIRHGTIPTLGVSIAGWAPGTHLDANGLKQADRLVERLADVPIAALWSSPLERTLETAAPLARHLGLEVKTTPDFGEIRYGAWTGKRFEELSNVAEWRDWNTFRSHARTPDGESMLQVQARAIGRLAELQDQHRDETIAVFSHGDVIRAVLAWYLGVPIDLFRRIEISPASISVLRIEDRGPSVSAVNVTERWVEE